MSIAKGPFYLHWQNLAHDDVWDRMHDEVSDLLAELAGPDVDQRWQDLSRARIRLHDLVDGKFGRLWQHGRAWLYIYGSAVERKADDGKRLGTIAAEWSIGRRQHSLGGSVYVDGGEGEITASLRVPRAGIYLTLPMPRSWRERVHYSYDRELGVTFHDGALWFKLWNHPHDWVGKAPFWDARSSLRQPTLHLDDLLLGKVQYRSEDLETMTGTLQLDEGYEVECRRFVSEWKRPRWPVPQRIMRVEIKVAGKGIPVPGKGENGWDCGDDAIFGATMPAKTIDEAARKVIADVQETRRKRGGRSWRPA